MTETSRRPWAARATELEPEAGHWADYAAWKEWIAKREAEYPFDEVSDIIGTTEHPEQTALYCIMCELADGKFSEAT